MNRSDVGMLWMMLPFALLLGCSSRASGAQDTEDMRDRLQRLARQLESETSPLSIPSQIVDRSDTAQQVIGLGLPAFPHIWEGLSKGHFKPTGQWVEICFRILKIHRDKDPLPRFRRANAKMEIALDGKITYRRGEPERHEPPYPGMGSLAWLQWRVKGGHKLAADEFGKLRERWQKVKGTGPVELWKDSTIIDSDTKELSTTREFTEAGRAYEQMRNLGIFLLPTLIEELKAGRYDFLPLLHDLTDGKAPAADAGKPDEMARHCIRWWKKHEDKWTVVPASIELKAGAPAAGERR